MTDVLDAEGRAALAPLLANGWEMVDGRDAIAKTVAFRDFADAFGPSGRSCVVQSGA